MRAQGRTRRKGNLIQIKSKIVRRVFWYKPTIGRTSRQFLVIFAHFAVGLQLQAAKKLQGSFHDNESVRKIKIQRLKCWILDHLLRHRSKLLPSYVCT